MKCPITLQPTYNAKATNNSIKIKATDLKLYVYKKLRGFGPLANYADRATTACWQSSANFCG
jgi:hypothetical protein